MYNLQLQLGMLRKKQTNIKFTCMGGIINEFWVHIMFLALVFMLIEM